MWHFQSLLSSSIYGVSNVDVIALTTKMYSYMGEIATSYENINRRIAMPSLVKTAIMTISVKSQKLIINEGEQHTLVF